MPVVRVLRCYPDGRQEEVEEDIELPTPPPPTTSLRDEVRDILSEMATLLQQGATPAAVSDMLKKKAEKL